MQWITDAWNWSRTIFINVVVALVLVANEVAAYALSVEWASVVKNPQTLFYITIGINVVNIALRVITTGPVGGKK